MKLFFVRDNKEQLIGEPSTPEELGMMVLEYSKKKFVLPKKFEFSFSSGSEFTVVGGDKFILKD